eukprot:7266425-Prorocentrum_lima.AAC.1
MKLLAPCFCLHVYALVLGGGGGVACLKDHLGLNIDDRYYANWIAEHWQKWQQHITEGLKLD